MNSPTLSDLTMYIANGCSCDAKRYKTITVCFLMLSWLLLLTVSANLDDNQLDQLLLEGSLHYEKEIGHQDEDSSLDNLLLQASLEYESLIQEEDMPGQFLMMKFNNI